MRIVRRPDGTVAIDETGRQPGRGAYLCRDAACFSLAGRRKALAHALGAPVPPEIDQMMAAGPVGLAAPAYETSRAEGSPPDTLHHTSSEGGAHGQK